MKPKILQDIDTLSSSLAEKANQSDLDTEKIRIDNLVANAGDVSNNAELLDIRVGTDGKTYSTSGNAIRNQVSEIKNQSLATLFQSKLKYTFDSGLTYSVGDTQNRLYILTNDKRSISFKKGTVIKSIQNFNIPSSDKTYTIYILTKSGNNYTCIDKISATMLTTGMSYINYVCSQDCYVAISSANWVFRMQTWASNYPSKSLERTTDVAVSIGTQFTPDTRGYISLGIKVNTECQIGEIQEVHVSADDTKDYTSLIEAINNITNSSSSNVHNVYLYEGTYDIYSQLGGTTYINSIVDTSNTMKGMLLPNYVNLIGIGNRDNIILQTLVPDDVATLNSSTCMSTLNLNQTNSIENITLITKNTRYAIHDETGATYSNVTRKIKNVKAVHQGNKAGLWVITSAYANGFNSNCNYEFDNCEFVSYQSNAMSMHDRENITPANITIKNSKLIGNKSLNFGSVGVASKKHNVLMVGNILSNAITMAIESGSTGSSSNFKVTGSGNSMVKNQCSNDNGANIEYFCFAEEYVYRRNGDSVTIPKGTCVESQYDVIIKQTDSSKYKFYGIAMHDIPVGEYGLVKIKGYLHRSVVGLATVNKGDAFGVSNATLTLSTDNIVAYRDDGGYIKLL